MTDAEREAVQLIQAAVADRAAWLAGSGHLNQPGDKEGAYAAKVAELRDDADRAARQRPRPSWDASDHAYRLERVASCRRRADRLAAALVKLVERRIALQVKIDRAAAAMGRFTDAEWRGVLSPRPR